MGLDHPGNYIRPFQGSRSQETSYNGTSVMGFEHSTGGLGVQWGGGSWGTLRIPARKIGKPQGAFHPPLRILVFFGNIFTTN